MLPGRPGEGLHICSGRTGMGGTCRPAHGRRPQLPRPHLALPPNRSPNARARGLRASELRANNRRPRRPPPHSAPAPPPAPPLSGNSASSGRGAAGGAGGRDMPLALGEGDAGRGWGSFDLGAASTLFARAVPVAVRLEGRPEQGGPLVLRILSGTSRASHSCRVSNADRPPFPFVSPCLSLILISATRGEGDAMSVRWVSCA